MRPTIIELPHVKWKSSYFIMLKSVAMFFVTVPDCAIMLTEVSSHSGDVTSESTEPSTDKILASRAYNLVYHP